MTHVEHFVDALANPHLDRPQLRWRRLPAMSHEFASVGIWPVNWGRGSFLPSNVRDSVAVERARYFYILA